MPAYDTHADRALAAAVDHLTTGRHRRQVTSRWSTDPTLGGHDPAYLLAVIHIGNHEQGDPIVTALLARSHAGDSDATTLLLAGLRPGLWALVHRYGRHQRTAFDDALAIATLVITRSEPTGTRLYHVLLGRIRAQLAATLRVDDAIELHDTIPDAAWLGRGDDPVGEQVTDRVTLQNLARLADRHRINLDAFAALVGTRIGGLTSQSFGPNAACIRAATSRLARQLVQVAA